MPSVSFANIFLALLPRTFCILIHVFGHFYESYDTVQTTAKKTRPNWKRLLKNQCRYDDLKKLFLMLFVNAWHSEDKVSTYRVTMKGFITMPKSRKNWRKWPLCWHDNSESKLSPTSHRGSKGNKWPSSDPTPTLDWHARERSTVQTPGL